MERSWSLISYIASTGGSDLDKDQTHAQSVPRSAPGSIGAQIAGRGINAKGGAAATVIRHHMHN